MNYFEGKYAEFMLHEHLGLHEPAYHVSEKIYICKCGCGIFHDDAHIVERQVWYEASRRSAAKLRSSYPVLKKKK